MSEREWVGGYIPPKKKNEIDHIASALKSARRFVRGALHELEKMEDPNNELKSYCTIAVYNIEQARVICHDLKGC